MFTSILLSLFMWTTTFHVQANLLLADEWIHEVSDSATFRSVTPGDMLIWRQSPNSFVSFGQLMSNPLTLGQTYTLTWEALMACGDDHPTPALDRCQFFGPVWTDRSLLSHSSTITCLEHTSKHVKPLRVRPGEWKTFKCTFLAEDLPCTSPRADPGCKQVVDNILSGIEGNEPMLAFTQYPYAWGCGCSEDALRFRNLDLSLNTSFAFVDLTDFASSASSSNSDDSRDDNYVLDPEVSTPVVTEDTEELNLNPITTTPEDSDLDTTTIEDPDPITTSAPKKPDPVTKIVVTEETDPVVVASLQDNISAMVNVSNSPIPSFSSSSVDTSTQSEHTHHGELDDIAIYIICVVGGVFVGACLLYCFQTLRGRCKNTFEILER